MTVCPCPESPDPSPAPMLGANSYVQASPPPPPCPFIILVSAIIMEKKALPRYRDDDDEGAEARPLIAEYEDNYTSSPSTPIITPAFVRRAATGLIFSLLLISLGVLGVAINEVAVYKHTKHAEVCMTPACVLAAAQIINSRSADYKDINPCDDFHTYMCGSFDEKHDFRDDQSAVGVLNIMSEENEVLIHHILEAPLDDAASGVEKDNYNKLHDAYASCMNETAIKEKGLKPVMEIIHKAEALFELRGFQIGGTRDPLDASAPEKSMSTILAYLMSVGIEPLIELGIGVSVSIPPIFFMLISLSPTRRIQTQTSSTLDLLAPSASQRRSTTRTRLSSNSTRRCSTRSRTNYILLSQTMLWINWWPLSNSWPPSRPMKNIVKTSPRHTIPRPCRRSLT